MNLPDDFSAEPSGSAVGRLWQLVFPSRCLRCGKRGVVVCKTCQPSISWLPAAVCPRCVVRTVDGRLCDRCARQTAAGGPPLSSVRAACAYEGLVRTALQRLKFRQARFLASFAAELIWASLSSRPLQVDVLVPVPLHPSRHQKRGFNQSELIARALADRLQVAVTTETLARTRDTPPQVGLTSQERRRNLVDAFSCPGGSAAGLRVALVDDIMTTGSTLEACAKPLIEAGAARVIALVVARDL